MQLASLVRVALPVAMLCACGGKGPASSTDAAVVDAATDGGNGAVDAAIPDAAAPDAAIPPGLVCLAGSTCTMADELACGEQCLELNPTEPSAILNPLELANHKPTHADCSPGGGTGALTGFDCDGDMILTVHDYAEWPLLMPAASNGHPQGDANGNGVLDAADIFLNTDDSIDDDKDGFVDDVFRLDCTCRPSACTCP